MQKTITKNNPRRTRGTVRHFACFRLYYIFGTLHMQMNTTKRTQHILHNHDSKHIWRHHFRQTIQIHDDIKQLDMNKRQERNNKSQAEKRWAYLDLKIFVKSNRTRENALHGFIHSTQRKFTTVLKAGYVFLIFTDQTHSSTKQFSLNQFCNMNFSGNFQHTNSVRTRALHEQCTHQHT